MDISKMLAMNIIQGFTESSSIGIELLVQFNTFSPPTHPGDKWLHFCLVYTLARYVEHTVSLGSSQQMFIFYGEGVCGKTLYKQQLAHWVCEIFK